MCELFAVSSAHPVGLCCSLVEFDEHGGGSAPHADGWGLARYVGRDVLLLKEAQAAARSELARWVRQHPMSSPLAIGHLRKATQGTPVFMNCQPFVRELGGTWHVFAHNGHLDRAALEALLPPGGPRPVGETDSERAFCVLLGMLAAAWREGTPGVGERAEAVREFARRLRELGPANFLYADAELLFAHGDRRMHGSEGIRPPGLWLLALDEGAAPACGTMAGLALPAPGPAAPGVVLASVPLSADPRWRPLSQGEVVVVREGAVVDKSAAP